MKRYRNMAHISSKPRILFATGVFPPAIGGPAAVLPPLINRLIEKCWLCRVVTFGNRGDGKGTYPIICASLSIPQPLRSIVVVWQMMRAAMRSDIIYTLDTYTHGLSACIASVLFRKPLILRFTGDSVWESLFNRGATQDDIVTFQTKSYGFRARLLKARRDLILRRARRIVTDCEFLKHLLMIIGVPEAKVVVINNPAPQTPQASAPAGSKSGRTLLSVGRLVPWKDQTTIITLMPRLLAQFPDLQFLIAGDGPERPGLENLIRNLKLEQSVRLLGAVAGTEKIKLYQNTDIFILHTRYEGMSNALLEAMASGIAVIATPAGGNPEFINQKNAVIVEYGRSEELFHALCDLLDSKERRYTLGENAREAARRFTLDSFVNKNIALIDSLYPAKLL